VTSPCNRGIVRESQGRRQVNVFWHQGQWDWKIDKQYADLVFQMFQRLHARDIQRQ